MSSQSKMNTVKPRIISRYLELDEAQNIVTVYARADKDGREEYVPRDARTTLDRSWFMLVLNAFLPAGYPKSVTKDYLWYQIYDSLQAFSSAIAGLLSSRAVLEGIGVGDSHASPTAALLLSVLQDSTGRIATILFAHRLGTSLEPECKMYRLLADVFNDTAMILDCISPLIPKIPRVFVLSCSSMLRALCGVAAGSSKASLSAHFATQGNLGELNAKDSSQETVISLMGMLVGSVVVSHISTAYATWTAMMILLAIHLGTNYLAVRAVSMRTLNRQRANLVFSAYLDNGNTFATPEDISAQERIFEQDGVLRWQGGPILGHCETGVPLSRLIFHYDGVSSTDAKFRETLDVRSASQLFEVFQDEDYVIWHNTRENRWLIVLKMGATPVSQLHAWMHVLFMTRQVALGKGFPKQLYAIVRARSALKHLTKDVLEEKLREKGWDVETGALETVSGFRIKEDIEAVGDNEKISF